MPSALERWASASSTIRHEQVADLRCYLDAVPDPRGCVYPLGALLAHHRPLRLTGRTRSTDFMQ
jgi:hypothetical protein